MTSSEPDAAGFASSSSAGQWSAGRASLGFRLSCPVSSLLLPCHLLDADVLDKTAADSEYRRQRIPHYEGERCVLDGGFQAQARQSSVSTQTQPVLQRPAVCQYEQQRMPSSQQEAEMQSDAMIGFLTRALPELETALLKNAAMDVFKDQLSLDDDDDDDAAAGAADQQQQQTNPAAAAAAVKGGRQQQTGARPGLSPSLFHSFHHLLYSRSHSVGWVDWHPARCCVAFSLIPSWSFDAWCDHSGEVSLSYILLYDLTQLLQPYAIVKVPGVVTCFRFHPTAHLLPPGPAAAPPPLLPAAAAACTPLIAGLQTGQIILYQIPNVPTSSAALSQRQQQQQPAPLQQQQVQAADSSSPSAAAMASPVPAAAPAASSQSSFLSSLSSSPSDGSAFLPSPLYTLLSNLDRSHGRPVSDLHWMPACQQINRKGERLSGAAGLTGCSSQLASFAADGKLLLWDYRQLNEAGQTQQQQQSASSSSLSSSHYAGSQDGDAAAAAAGLMSSEDYHEKRDGKWSPLFVLPLQQPQPGQGQPADGEEQRGESGSSSDSQQAAALAVAVNSQVRLSSSFPVSASTLTARRVAAGPSPSSPLLLSVTEDGEVLEVDTSARAAAESHGSGAVGSVVRRLRVHSTVGVSIDRSAVLPSLYVSCGEATFALCQVGDDLPVFVSPACPPACSYMTARCSPTRPAVLCLARSDGVIEIWDCLDQTHTPAFLFPTGSADALLSLSFQQSQSGSGEGGSSRQYLAAGDSGGKCHIVEIPRSLRRRLAGEEQAMLRWLDRERQRGREAQRRLLHKSRAGPLQSALTPYQQQMQANPKLFHAAAAAAAPQQTDTEAASAVGNGGSSSLPSSSPAASSSAASSSSSSSGSGDAAAEGEYAAVSAAALASLAAALKEAEAASVSQ